MKIEVIGSGCTKCKRLKKNVDEAVKKLGLDPSSVRMVDSMEEIMERGIMMTPTLVINGKIVAQGRVLSVKQLIDILGK